MRACRLRQVAVASLAIAGALMVAPRLAAANKRIAVLAVKGAGSSGLDADVEQIVGDHCVVISDAKYLRAAKAVRARTLKPAHVRKVAAKIRADGVVRGWLQQDGDGYLLRIRLYEGATGEVVKKLAVRLSDDRISSKVRRVISKRLHAAIDDLSPLRRSRSYDDEDEYEDEPEDDGESRRAAERRRRAEKERELERRRQAEREREEEQRRRAEREREEERRREMAEKRRREEERRRRAEEKRRKQEEKERLARLLPADHEDEENPFAAKTPKKVKKAKKAEAPKKVKKAKKAKKAKKPKKPKKPRKRTAERGDDYDDEYEGEDEEDAYSTKRNFSFEDDSLWGASISIGVTAVTRTLEFTSREGLANPPEGYKGPLVPSLLVAADVYPAALTDKKGAMAKLGIGFMLDRVFGLETAVGGVDSVTLPTTQMSYGMSLKLRHRFRKAAYKPTVIASFGFRRLDFSVDKSSAPAGVTVDLPNTAYTYFYPGLELHAQLKRKIAASAEFRFPLVTGVGEMQEPQQYGAATITGFDVGLGLDYKLSSRLRASAGVRYLALGFDFKGTGEQAVNRDGDPATEDVAGALDKYLRVYLTASYSF